VSKQEGWMRRAELLVAVAAAVVLALAYVVSRVFGS
jgi:hypothetical protein